MSAFVVDPQTINTIVNALRCAVRQEHRYPAKFPDLRYLEDQTLREQVIENPAELGRVLYAIHCHSPHPGLMLHGADRRRRGGCLTV